MYHRDAGRLLYKYGYVAVTNDEGTHDASGQMDVFQQPPQELLLPCHIFMNK